MSQSRCSGWGKETISQMKGLMKCFRPVLLTLSYAFKSLGDVQVLIQEVNEGARDCNSYKISSDADAVKRRLIIDTFGHRESEVPAQSHGHSGKLLITECSMCFP